MRWFRRRERLDLGRYVAPAPTAPAPIEQIVADGSLIGDSVVRLTIRNRVIVDALRDRRDLDIGVLEEAAATEFERLADQEWESAERIRLRRNVRLSDLDDFGADAEWQSENQRREDVHRAMSNAFAARATARAAIVELVEQARAEAWSEIGAVLLERAGERAFELERDAGYDAQRADRVGMLLALDLTRLAQERGVDL